MRADGCVKKSLFVRHARGLQVCVPSSLARAGRFKRDSIALGQEGLGGVPLPGVYFSLCILRQNF